jgi:hypothetical protein
MSAETQAIRRHGSGCRRSRLERRRARYRHGTCRTGVFDVAVHPGAADGALCAARACPPSGGWRPPRSQRSVGSADSGLVSGSVRAVFRGHAVCRGQTRVGAETAPHGVACDPFGSIRRDVGVRDRQDGSGEGRRAPSASAPQGAFSRVIEFCSGLVDFVVLRTSPCGRWSSSHPCERAIRGSDIRVRCGISIFFPMD